MTNTTYLNLFPVRIRRRPSDVQHLAHTSAEASEQSKSDSVSTSPFSNQRIERAFHLMGQWNSGSSAEQSLSLSTLAQ